MERAPIITPINQKAAGGEGVTGTSSSQQTNIDSSSGVAHNTAPVDRSTMYYGCSMHADPQATVPTSIPAAITRSVGITSTCHNVRSYNTIALQSAMCYRQTNLSQDEEGSGDEAVDTSNIRLSSRTTTSAGRWVPLPIGMLFV